MNPDIWGPHAWFLLYSVALAYPEEPTKEDKTNYFNFYMSLQDVLPCLKCRVHYSQHIKNIPLTDDILNNKLSLFKWVHTIQSAVKESQGKKPYTLSSTIEYFNKSYSTNKELYKDMKKWYILVPIILIIIGILGIVFLNKKKKLELN